MPDSEEAQRATLRRRLIAILLLSLALRVAAPFAFPDFAGEETRRQQIAVNLAEGRGFSLCMGYFPFCSTPDNDTTASVGPLPVLVFAGFIALFGDFGVPAILAFQALLGVWITYLTWRISLRVFGHPSAALLAALLFAIYPPMIQYGMRLRGETLATVLVALLFLLLPAALERGRARHWLGVGVLFGLTALARTSFLYFVAVLAVVLPFLAQASGVRRLLAPVAVVAGFSLLLAPWVTRNALEFGAFIPGTTLTGYNLYRHNHILAEGLPPHYVANEEVGDAINRLIAAHPELTGNENENEMDAFYRESAMQIIGQHPGRYVEASLLRFVALWSNAREYGFGALTGAIVILGVVNLALLGLAVAASLRRRLVSPPVLLLMVLLIVYVTVGHMLVNARVRFLGPVIPLLVVLAADQVLGRRPAHRSAPEPEAGPVSVRRVPPHAGC